MLQCVNQIKTVALGTAKGIKIGYSGKVEDVQNKEHNLVVKTYWKGTRFAEFISRVKYISATFFTVK